MSNLLLTYTRREVTNIMMEDFFSKMTGENDPDVSLRAIPSCDLSAEDIAWSDIILAVRPQGSIIANILRIGHRLGKLRVSMVDDDFFAIICNKLFERNIILIIANDKSIFTFARFLRRIFYLSRISPLPLCKA